MSKKIDELSFAVARKVANGQKNINTNKNLSEHGYITGNIRKGVQQWRKYDDEYRERNRKNMVERYCKSDAYKEYRKTETYKKYHREYEREYQKTYRKTEKYKDREKKYHAPGTLQYERNRIRTKHSHQYRPFKKIIDSESHTCIHHLWHTNLATYDAIAIVETKEHQRSHAFVKPILLFDGNIELTKDNLEFIKNHIK